MSDTHRTPKLASDRHLAFAARYGLSAQPGITKRDLFDQILEAIAAPGRELEMVSWFVYRVYRELGHGRDAAGIQGPDDPVIQDIATGLAADPAVVKSIRRYRGRDLIWFGRWTTPDGLEVHGGSNATIAYKAAATALRQKIALGQVASTSSARSSRSSPKPRAEAAGDSGGKGGCASVLIVALMSGLAVLALARVVLG